MPWPYCWPRKPAELKPMTHSPDFGAETRRRSAPKINRRIRNRSGAGRLRPAPDRYDTQSRKSAPIFGAEFRRRNLDCVSSALDYSVNVGLNSISSSSSSSSSSGTMGPAPVGVRCLSCNKFPSSAILGQTVHTVLIFLFIPSGSINMYVYRC